jgi:hypothetical protein
MLWVTLLAPIFTVNALLPRLTLPAPTVSSNNELVLGAWIVKFPELVVIVLEPPPNVRAVEVNVL